MMAAGCAQPSSPIAPTAPVPPAPQKITLEAEAGTGDGDLHQRSQASGAMTIHLAPGQRRSWTFIGAAPGSTYAVYVTYSNDNPGESETLHVDIDGIRIGTVRARDTGDDGAGWEIFVADLAGASTVAAGTHTITVESSGGDGCIEIDKITLEPQSDR